MVFSSSFSSMLKVRVLSKAETSFGDWGMVFKDRLKGLRESQVLSLFCVYVFFSGNKKSKIIRKRGP